MFKRMSGVLLASLGVFAILVGFIVIWNSYTTLTGIVGGVILVIGVSSVYFAVKILFKR